MVFVLYMEGQEQHDTHHMGSTYASDTEGITSKEWYEGEDFFCGWMDT